MRLAASLFCVSGSLLCVCACGRLEFARTDAAPTGPDGGVDLGPFGSPQVIGALSDPLKDDDPTITGDALELYFSSERGGASTGFSDIYLSTRASLASPWSTPTPVTELNTADEEQTPGITADGLTIYFSSRRPTSQISGASANTWVATRPDRASPWSAPQLVAELSTTQDEFEPQPDASNTHLVFYRQINSTDRNLFIAARATPSLAWDPPSQITELNTAGEERAPFLSADGRTIWFSSDRMSATAGVNDLYVATRASRGEPFGAPAALTELNTGASDEDDPSLSDDGRVIVFTNNSTGNYEIYEARR